MDERRSGGECRTAGNAGKRGLEWAEGRRKGEEEKKGVMNERRSGGECCMAGNVGKRGPEWAEGRRKGGRRKKEGGGMSGGVGKWGSGEVGKWGSGEVKERRYLFRHKRATDLVEAEESRARSRRAGPGAGAGERAARSGLPFRVQGGLLWKGGKERALPNRSAGLVYAVADAGVRVRASCGFPSEGPAC